MGACEHHCQLGLMWWQVTVVVAAAFVCLILLEVVDRWFDRIAARHTPEPGPIEGAADSVPLETGDDEQSFREWAESRTAEEPPPDDGWTPRRPDDLDDTEIIEGTLVEDRLLDERDYTVPVEKARWWIVRNTLHLTTCPQVTRVKKAANFGEYAQPITVIDERVVWAWADRQKLHLCGRCHPLSASPETIEA